MLRACFLLSLLLSTNSVANTFMPTGADGGTYHAIGKDIAHIVIPVSYTHLTLPTKA